MSTLDRPKKNGTTKAGATFTRVLKDAWGDPRYLNAGLTRILPVTPKVKKGCGQRKNKRDRDGRARHALTCFMQQRYPGADAEFIRAQKISR